MHFQHINTTRTSFPVHRKSAGELHFLRFLTQSEQGAAQVAHEVPETASLDPFLVSYLAADKGSRDKVDRIAEHGESAKTATVSNGLGVLPERVAGAEVGDDAQSAVIEAAAYSVGPLTRHIAQVLIMDHVQVEPS